MPRPVSGPGSWITTATTTSSVRMITSLRCGPARRKAPGVLLGAPPGSSPGFRLPSPATDGPVAFGRQDSQQDFHSDSCRVVAGGCRRDVPGGGRKGTLPKRQRPERRLGVIEGAAEIVGGLVV